jgi:hypothetical protein
MRPSHAEHRFDRQFKALARAFPRLQKPINWLRAPGGMLIRIPIAILLILGGFLAILPIFGLWMIPLGLLLLAVDVTWLRGPVAGAIVRGRRKLNGWRRRLKR